MRRQRKTYERPFKRWDKARIIEEAKLMREYGLKNKRELWKARSIIRRFRAQARALFAKEQGREELFAKVKKLGLLRGDITLDDVLGLKVEDLLERRLQTLVYRKGLASTINQARQLIVHRHIAIGGRVVDVPGYIVTVDEEPLISYAPNSPLSNPEHPLRQAGKEEKREKKEEKKKEKKEEEVVDEEVEELAKKEVTEE